MKTFALSLATLLLTLQLSHASKGSDCLRSAVKVTSSFTGDASKDLKSLNAAIKECRTMITAERKEQSRIKRKAKLEAQIKKAQEKLAHLK